MKNGQDYSFSEEIKKAIADMGFTVMTEIQQKAIPILMEGKEVIAKAPTGTGKTCAFGIPIIEKIHGSLPEMQALILCPTRELAGQITEDMRRLAKYKPEIRIAAVYGGQPMMAQVDALKKMPQVVVATPGRLIDHLKRRNLQLSKVRMVVLDEADEMLDMGFFKDVRWILDRLPKQKQMVMFSATISRAVMDIGWIYQRDAVELEVLPVEESKPKITQYSLETTGKSKADDLMLLLKSGDYQRTMIFCNTKFATASLSGTLVSAGFNAGCIHGDMTQAARNQMMAFFKQGKVDHLVATDVAARGIDVSDVDAVFNYDVPQDNSYYTHRIGRTGRAKKEGISYILYLFHEQGKLKEIVKFTKAEIIPLVLNEKRELIEKETN